MFVNWLSFYFLKNKKGVGRKLELNLFHTTFINHICLSYSQYFNDNEMIRSTFIHNHSSNKTVEQ